MKEKRRERNRQLKEQRAVEREERREQRERMRQQKWLNKEERKRWREEYLQRKKERAERRQMKLKKQEERAKKVGDYSLYCILTLSAFVPCMSVLLMRKVNSLPICSFSSTLVCWKLFSPP